MEIKITLNEDKILKKLNNEQFGIFVSKSWKKLIDPYTTRDTSMLMNNVMVKPFELHYREKYANRVYHGKTFKFNRNTNPFATYEWDLKAAQSGQLSKLYKTINNYLNK